MTLNPAYSTRTVSLLLIAAFAAVALWLFLPWDRSASNWDGSGDAALPPTLKVDGTVDVTSKDNVVTRLVIPVTLWGDEGVALGGGTVRAETSLSESAAAAVPATYSVEWLSGNGDSILDKGEQALVTVDLPERTSVHPGNPLRIVIKPVDSVSLVIEDVLP
jgi:hypothetical protein